MRLRLCSFRKFHSALFSFGFLLFLSFSPQNLCVESLRAVFFLAGTNEPQRALFEWIAQQLARHNHHVSTVKPVLVPEESRLVRPTLYLVHEKVLKNVLPRGLYEPLAGVGSVWPWTEEYSVEDHLEPLWAAHNHSCYKMLNSNLMDLLRGEQLDLAVVYTGNPCLLGLVHALDLPFVLVDPEGLGMELRVASGAPWQLPRIFGPDTSSTGTDSSGTPSTCLKNSDPSSTCCVSSLLQFIQQRFAMAGEFLAEELAQMEISTEGSFGQLFHRLLESLSKKQRLLGAPVSAIFQRDWDIQRRFKQRGGFPASVKSIAKNAVLYMANTDPLLEDPDLALPANVLSIGGAHIDHVKPLFSPWNETLTHGAPHGVILVSFGTQADTGAMPEPFARALFHALLRLPRTIRVIWRLAPKLALPGVAPGGGAELDRVLAAHGATNINVTTFFPQNELLASPRCRLLVTNGGMNTVQETLHWGVPLVGVPLWGRDRDTLELVERRGFGVVVPKRALLQRGSEARDSRNSSRDNTEENYGQHPDGSELLYRAIKKVLYDPKFSARARELSQEVRNRPVAPLDRVLHALETAAATGRSRRRRTRASSGGPHSGQHLQGGAALKQAIFRGIFGANLDLVLVGLASLAFVLWTTFFTVKLVLKCALRVGRLVLRRLHELCCTISTPWRGTKSGSQKKKNFKLD